MSKALNFQAPFERLKFLNISPEASLRKAIIIQAVIDSCSEAKDSRGIKNKKEAINWIFSGDSHFIKTCEEAGVEPDCVVKLTKELLLYQSEAFEIIFSQTNPKKARKKL
jgi:hypothetical protein